MRGASIGTHEQHVLPVERDRVDGALDGVVIEFDANVFDKARQAVPARQGVADGSGELALLADQTEFCAQPRLGRAAPGERLEAIPGAHHPPTEIRLPARLRIWRRAGPCAPTTHQRRMPTEAAIAQVLVSKYTVAVSPGEIYTRQGIELDRYWRTVSAQRVVHSDANACSCRSNGADLGRDIERDALPDAGDSRICDAVALDVRPIKITLKAEHHISLLDLGTHGAAEHPATDIEAGMVEPVGDERQRILRAPAVTAIHTDIKAGPVIDLGPTGALL